MDGASFTRTKKLENHQSKLEDGATLLDSLNMEKQKLYRILEPFWILVYRIFKEKTMEGREDNVWIAKCKDCCNTAGWIIL